MASLTAVEMGETGVARAADGRLTANGLGACVGLCLYEAAARIAVLVHVVLPATLPLSPARPSSAAHPPFTPPPGKCADTALAHALAEIVRQGGQVGRVEAALVGGAQIFSAPGGDAAPPSRLEIGQRNVLALKEELGRAGVTLRAEDTGGHGGRTVALDASTGAVSVRPVGLGERLLITLGQQVPEEKTPGRKTPSSEAVSHGEGVFACAA